LDPTIIEHLGNYDVAYPFGALIEYEAYGINFRLITDLPKDFFLSRDTPVPLQYSIRRKMPSRLPG
jgi:hypothetical protein